jgi:hypothetical protein
MKNVVFWNVTPCNLAGSLTAVTHLVQLNLDSSLSSNVRNRKDGGDRALGAGTYKIGFVQEPQKLKCVSGETIQP